MSDLVRQWRSDTPGCSATVFLDHAGASLQPAVVTHTVVEHLRAEERLGGYEAAAAAGDRMERVYASVATLVGADADEIALVENATRAWDMAFYAVPFEPGDTVLTGVAEYASNYLAFLHARRTRGLEIVVVPDDESGQLDVEALDRLVDERTRLIAVTHAPTNGGLVNPAAEIGRVARSHGVLYLLDACQSVGQLPVDVDAIGCDFLSVTGRKFLRGPRGTGFLFARRDTTAGLHPPFIDLQAATWTARDDYALRPDARRFENWESYVAGRLGLGAAVDYALGVGTDVIRDRVLALSTRLRAGLATVPGVRVRDKGTTLSGIVTFTVEGLPAAEVRARLRSSDVVVNTTLDIYTRLDFESRDLPEMVRASVHYVTAEDEVDQAVAAVRDLAG